MNREQQVIAEQDDGLGNVRMLNAKDLSLCLKVSTRQIHRMNRSALIPAPLLLGGCTRWSVIEVAAWLRAGSPPRNEWELLREAALAPTVGDVTCE